MNNTEKETVNIPEEDQDSDIKKSEKTAFEKQKRLNRLFYGVAAIGLISVGYGIYSYSNRIIKTPAIIASPKPSEPIYEAPVAKYRDNRTVSSRLEIEPQVATFSSLQAGRDRQVATIRIKAVNGPVQINSIQLPFALQSYLDMRNPDCNRLLEMNQSCTIILNFAPLTPVILNNQVIINATAYEMIGDQQGKNLNISANIEITGQSIPEPLSPVSTPTIPLVSREPEYQKNRDDYLSRRQQVGSLSAQQSETGYQAPRKPQDANWDSIGFKANVSTLPVDMSRVVTMDKPIPVVLKIGIETRQASRAVATVERDIYGGDGRTVLIERGSTLIGIVSAISSVGEEKVAIAWQRLIRPDGAAFSFQATTGDAMGRSGALALLDNRFFERFGKTALASIISAGGTIAINGTQTSTTQNGTTASGIGASVTTGGTTNTSQDAKSIASQQLRQDFTPLYETFKKEQLAIPPIRVIPAGTRLTIWPSTDLWLQATTSEDIKTATPQVFKSYKSPAIPNNISKPINTFNPASLQTQSQTGISTGPGNPIYPEGTQNPAPIGDYPVPTVSTALPTETANEIGLVEQDKAAKARLLQQQLQAQQQTGVAGVSGRVLVAPPWAQGQ